MGDLTQAIPYKEYTTTERNALVNVKPGFVIENTTVSKYQMWTGSVWNNVYVNSEYYYFDASVGVGGDYNTIQEALASGKYRIKLISDVTETVLWEGASIPDLIIESDELRTITLSLWNTIDTNIYMKNININLIGTNPAFGYSYLFLTTCTVSGDSDASRLHISLGGITADYLTIHNAGGNFSILNISHIGTLDINGVYTRLYIDDGTIDVVINNVPGLLLDMLQNIIINSIVGSDLTAYMRVNNIIKSSAAILSAPIVNTNNRIENATISLLQNDLLNPRIYYIIGCIITSIELNQNAKIFKNNTVISAEILEGDGGNIIENCVFENGITIEADNCTLINCSCTNGTITIDATADKTVIIEPRTLTPIVDNGTNTQIILPNLI